MITLLFGAPGTGKSTYAKYLAEKTSSEWISTGKLFREIAERDNRIKELLEAGKLVPDEEVNRVIFDRLSKTSGSFTLDGFPRTVGQAESFSKFLDSRSWKVGKIFRLSVPVEVVLSRMAARGRADDDPAVIKERFEIFEEQTAPVLAYFASHGVPVIDIDNTPPIEEVKKQFDNYLQ